MQRTDLQTRDLPFKSELAKSVTTDLVAHAVVEGPPSAEAPWLDGKYAGFNRSGYSYESDHWANWLISRDGFMLNDRYLIEKFAPEYLVIAIGGPRGYLGWGDRLRSSLPDKFLFASFLPDSLADLNQRIKGLFQSVMTGYLRFWSAEYTPICAFVPDLLVDKIKTMRPGRSVLDELKYLASIPSKKGWRSFPFKLPEGVAVPPELMRCIVKEISSIKIDEKNLAMFAVIKPTKWRTEDYDTTIGAQWLRDWVSPLVPFNSTKRRKLERNASTLAAEFIAIRKEGLKRSERTDQAGG